MVILNISDSDFDEKVLNDKNIVLKIFGQNGVAYANKFLLF